MASELARTSSFMLEAASDYEPTLQWSAPMPEVLIALLENVYVCEAIPARPVTE